MAFTSSNGQTRTSLAEINITPLVDVVLVLLVIFMITAPVLQSGIEVAVPKTRTVKEITEQRLVVTIDRDQQVFLGDKPVNIHDLAAKAARSERRSGAAGDLSARRRAGSVWRVCQRDGRGEAGGDHQHFHCDPAAGYKGSVVERSSAADMSRLLEGGEQLERGAERRSRWPAPAAGSLLLHRRAGRADRVYGVLGGLLPSQPVGQRQERRSHSGEPGYQCAARCPPISRRMRTCWPPRRPARRPRRPAPRNQAGGGRRRHSRFQGKQVKPQAGRPRRKTQPHQPQPKPGQPRAVWRAERARRCRGRRSRRARSNLARRRSATATSAAAFGWYVDSINTQDGQNWNKHEVDPRTPKGAGVYLDFTIHRDGTPIECAASTSPAAARRSIAPACAACERVDTFGALPPDYNRSTLECLLLL